MPPKKTLKSIPIEDDASGDEVESGSENEESEDGADGSDASDSGSEAGDELPALTMDLNVDLNAALTKRLAKTSSYYHRSIDANSPNPGLTIDGVGAIGLPLSERDAQAIISQVSPAPAAPAKGRKKAVKPAAVQNSWEIKPASVSFRNPKWIDFVNQAATEHVWKTLGVAPPSTAPKRELDKLVLYQEGPLPSPKKGTKTKGTFCTIMIVLPSEFSGGEVHVSHDGYTTVLDVSQGSEFNTSILAWYTDATHEMKPLTSGYRLVLSYNLINTSSDSPSPPTLPEGTLERFTEILDLWTTNKYKVGLGRPLFVKPLEGHYSEDILTGGVSALKGKDANLIAHLSPIAEEKGVVLCLANIERHVLGTSKEPEESCESRMLMFNLKRRKYDVDLGAFSEIMRKEWEKERDMEPEMGYVEDEKLKLSDVVRITNNGAENFKLENFDLDPRSLIPLTAFDKMKPTKKLLPDGIGGDLDLWYNRSALVLFREADESSVLNPVSVPVTGQKRKYGFR